jgi:homoprotocatechuate degradation regulator HpaR
MTSSENGNNDDGFRSGIVNETDENLGRRHFYRALPMDLLRIREAMMRRFRPILLVRGLTDQQWRIIRALADRDSAEILTLSDLCVMHPASLSRILPKMEASGLITRTVNEVDKRRVVVALSAAGRDLFEEIVPDSEAIYETILADVGAERLQAFYGLIDEIIDVLEVSPNENRA